MFHVRSSHAGKNDCGQGAAMESRSSCRTTAQAKEYAVATIQFNQTWEIK